MLNWLICSIAQAGRMSLKTIQPRKGVMASPNNELSTQEIVFERRSECDNSKKFPACNKVL